MMGKKWRVKRRWKRSLLYDIYQFDDTRNAFIIEVDLDSYTEVFNEWDYAPFRKKDMEPELLAYLEDCILDIPDTYNLVIRLHLPVQAQDVEKEKAVRAGVRNFFKLTLAMDERQVVGIRRKAMQYASFAVGFLTLAYVMERWPVGLLFKVLQEGVFVGGWVFAWEAFSELFFEVREVRKEQKRYKRLFKAELLFAYGHTKVRLRNQEGIPKV